MALKLLREPLAKARALNGNLRSVHSGTFRPRRLDTVPAIAALVPRLEEKPAPALRCAAREQRSAADDEHRKHRMVQLVRNVAAFVEMTTFQSPTPSRSSCR